MTPVFSKVLKRHIQAGNLVVHTNTFISSQKYDEESKLWSIGTEPPPATDLPHFDHIYFATGTHLDVNQLAMLQTMQRRFPIDSYGGFPALTDDLMWADDVPLFMTGKLATLQIGPGAANLEGARLSAERIAWGVEKALGESSGRLEGEHVDDNPRDSYVDGIGSKFAQLPEE